MKRFFKLFSILALAAVGAAAVGVATSSPKVEAAEASSYSGRLVIKDNVGWYDGGENVTKAAVYLWNGQNGASKKEGWSKSFSLSAGTGHCYVAEYSGLDFEPVKMIVVRMYSSCPEQPTDWSKQAFGNQTHDLDVHDATSMNGWSDGKVYCSDWAITGNVYTSKNSFSSPKVSMKVDTVEIVDDNQPQVSGYVTLDENEEFKVVNVADNTWSSFFATPGALGSCFSGGASSKEAGTQEGSPNIKCLIPGTYEFFFNTETKRTWITRQDVVDADVWATYFNNNVGCDSQGIALPSGWSNCATEYGKLSGDAKDYIYGAKADEHGDNLARALATYDYAVAHHSTLEKFIKNSSDVVRATINLDRTSSLFATNSSDMTLAIVVISLVSVSAVAGFYFIRKRKHN